MNSSTQSDLITIVKLGGAIIDNESQLSVFLESFCRIGGKKILVHGGGKLASALCKKLGIETKMMNGRRITDAETLDVATMIYGGSVNKNIVAQLQKNNCNAIGMCGADGNIIRAEKRNPVPVDYGFVGDPVDDGINVTMLEQLLTLGLVPVISPLTHDGKGMLLNTNADTIAACVAGALARTHDVQLVYCFEKNGVLTDLSNENSVIRELKKEELKNFVEQQIIHNGMLPKIDACFRAKEKGVQRVVIGNASQLEKIAAGNNCCTLLT
ncbi:MAG: acetylglutamate kinase [Bacteroidetes bacterium]|nr:acetylglutamate kinase [Bacteroidota bacterium]